MDPMLVPIDVTEALAALDFRAVAPAGPEGVGWLAVSAGEPAHYVELHVLPAVLDDELARRLDVLRAVRHPHLAQLLDARELAPGRIALLVEHVPGLTVAELFAARAPLTDGEGVTLAVPVLQALAALHTAGLVHGPVTAATVVVRPDGRPVLTDLRGAVLGTGSVDGDVRRWLSTVVAHLPGADVDALVTPPGGPTLRQLLEASLRADVTIDALVADCFAVAEPEALRQPEPGLLAARELARTAGRRDAAVTPRRASRRAGSSPPGTPSSRRLRRAGVGAVALCLAATVGLAAVDGRLGHLGERAAAASEPANLRPDAVQAAIGLSQARAQVLASGDAAGLARVEVVGGPAHTSDTGLMQDLAGTRMEGLTVDVRSAAQASPRGGVDAPRVVVISSVPAHTEVAADGSRRRVDASDERSVVLELHWTADGWRVWSVSAA